MIYHIKGDLLASDCNIIAHQSNCHGGFGSGIAGQIRIKYPGAYEAFKLDVRLPEEKLGSYSRAFCKNSIFGDKDIFNLYGQFHYGNNPNIVYTHYKELEAALNMMLYWVNMYGDSTSKVGLPYLIGCGLANGDWKIVYKIISDASDRANIPIYLYEYTP